MATMTSPAPSPAPGATPASRRSSTSSDSFDHGRFAPGTMLGDRYRVVARLGVGGMGEVFRADDLKLGQPVALKFLPESVERDPVRLDKFTAEVRTARQISHPNVCRVYDVGEIDGRAFLTMEYVDGEDLKGLLRRIGRLPEDKGLEIARQICAGLAAIHDRGVLHRDLKPANIMLDGRGRVRLTDFGLATATVGAGTDGEIAGTPAYMAPEQLAGQPLSAATDLFALGLVLFELFTGERVQKGEDAGAIRDAQRARKPNTLTTTGSGAKLDPMVQRVIDRCLDRDPARRPQSAIVVAAALPGGDPLAAALAAGETPSPQMVAAAGEEGGLPFKFAVPLLVAVILGVVLVAWQQGRGSYASKVAFPHSPEVLSSKAKEMLVRLGYTEPVVGRETGFRSTSHYLDWVKEHDKTATRWQLIASVKPAIVRFWQRTSPAALIPENYFSGGPGGGVVTSFDDPPLTTAGMTYLELDPQGLLVELEAVVSDHDTTTTVAPAPDWPALFREAGLDQSAFKPATPEWWGKAPSDARAAWVGPGADSGGAELRVEAAAFHGRPVFFRLVAPWSKSNSAPTPQTGSEQAINAIVLSILLGIPIAAIVLSLRNLRHGRMDTRGATRLAVSGGGVVLLAAVLGSDVPIGEAWITSSFMIGSWAAFSALLIWAFYAAVEPYVRRHWPQMLISWSRLLDGRWRDPLVGRDLLIGCVLGLALTQLNEAQAAIERWRGEPPPLPTPATAAWTGLRTAAAVVIASVPNAVWVALGIVVLLVVLRLVLRREWAAAIGFVVILVAPSLLEPGATLVGNLFQVASAVIFAIIATRFGLMMFATVLLTLQILGRSGGFGDPAFAMGAVFLGLAAAAAPGVFGFFTATRGRKGTAWLDG